MMLAAAHEFSTKCDAAAFVHGDVLIGASQKGLSGSGWVGLEVALRLEIFTALVALINKCTRSISNL
jgi:hypothetical protein